MFCENCGRRNGTIGRYCEYCGRETGFIGYGTGKATHIRRSSDSRYDIRVRSTDTGMLRGAAGVMLKTVTTAAIAVMLAVALLSAYFTYFVPSPDAVVEKAFNAMDRLDINTLMTCVDPQSEKMYNATAKIASGVMGKLTGVSIDMKDILEFAPFLPGIVQSTSGGKMERLRYNAEVRTISIIGSKLSSFTKEYGNTVKWIGNALGDEAIVEIIINEDGKENGPRRAYRGTVKNYGTAGWRIPLDSGFAPKK